MLSLALAREQPESEYEFIQWCVNDPRYFIEQCTQIRLETGPREPWRFNSVQALHHDALYCYHEPHLAVRRIHDALILKSRQYGQSTYEIAILFWSWAFKPGYVAKVIAYRDDTAEKLKLMADTFYTSARQYFSSIGMDPDEWFTLASTDNKHELHCAGTGSILEFTSEGAKGEGRAVTVNALYGTEFSEWKNSRDVMAGFGGSLVKDGSAIVTLDGTGKGIGNPLHVEYTAAKDGRSVYTPFFYGRDDYRYPPGFLARQRKRLGKKLYNQEYPGTDVDAFSRADNSMFEPDDLKACFKRDQYYATQHGDAVWRTRPRVAGVDTAEGVADGNYSCVSVWDAETLHEAQQSWHERQDSVAIVQEMVRVLGWDGETATRGWCLFVIESNAIGKATILLAVAAGLGPFLYRHQQPKKKLHECKYGWPASGGEVSGTKPIREGNASRLLGDGDVTICGDNLMTEMLQYCRNENGKTGKPLNGEYYDDEADAAQMAWVGQEQALMLYYSARDEEHMVVGSMKGDRS